MIRFASIMVFALLNWLGQPGSLQVSSWLGDSAYAQEAQTGASGEISERGLSKDIFIPNLIPLAANPCPLTNGKLSLAVKNQGNAIANESIALVYSPTGVAPVGVRIASLQPGQVQSFAVSVPCSNEGACNWTLTADIVYEVREGSEGDNSISGTCFVVK